MQQSLLLLLARGIMGPDPPVGSCEELRSCITSVIIVSSAQGGGKPETDVSGLSTNSAHCCVYRDSDRDVDLLLSTRLMKLVLPSFDRLQPNRGDDERPSG